MQHVFGRMVRQDYDLELETSYRYFLRRQETAIHGKTNYGFFRKIVYIGGFPLLFFRFGHLDSKFESEDAAEPAAP